MNLSNLLTRNPEKIDRYFALEINPDVVKAAVWTVEEQKIEIISHGEIVNVKENTDEGLLDAVDIALATANEGLNQEINGVILGLPEDWLDETGILDTKKETLKYLCQQLELKPLGYVVTLEGLITFLKEQQGTPPSAIFVRYSEAELSIAIVDLGIIKKHIRVLNTKDVAKDLYLALKNNYPRGVTLPARIILYDGRSDLELVKHNLAAFSWETELPFVYAPSIQVLEPNVTITAISISGGKEVAVSLGIEIIGGGDLVAETNQDTPELSESILEVEEMTAQKSHSLSDFIDHENLPEGFVVGIDEDGTQSYEKQTEKQKQKSQKSAAVFVSLKKITQKIFHPDNFIGLKKSFAGISQISSLFFTSFFKRNKSSSTEKESHEHHKKVTPSLKKPLLFGGVLVLLLATMIGGFFWFYYNVPTAQIELTFFPKEFNQDIGITASTKVLEMDSNNLILPVNSQVITVNGSETLETTGTKRIGEKSKGKVSLFNKTSSSKTLDKGTILIDSNSLRFVLTEKVSIASQSSTVNANEETLLTPGKADASIEAGDIGDKYDLADGSKLSVKGYTDSQLSAKTVGEVKGGTSESISVVSKEDIAQLKTNITQSLTKKAQDQLQQGNTQIMVLGDKFDANLIDPVFDKKEGDKAATLNLDASLELKAFTVKTDEYEKAMKETIKKTIEADYQLLNNLVDSKIDLVEPEDENGIMRLTVKVNTQLIPKMDFVKMKQDLSGKSQTIAMEYLKKLPAIATADIVVSPELPSPFNTLPQKTDNITFVSKVAE